MLKKHSSLMAYFGSKRKLCRHIFKHLDRPDGKEVVFIDAFMGGGSVSLYAKQIGYKVVAGTSVSGGRSLGKHEHWKLGSKRTAAGNEEVQTKGSAI
jgi:hypothetical protein